MNRSGNLVRDRPLANNNKRNQPRKSSTNMRSLSNRVQYLMNETNPVPRASAGSPTPRPMRKQRAVYLSRKVRVYKQVPTTAKNVSVTLGDLLSQLSTAASATLRVDGAQAWNMTTQGLSTNYVGLGFSSDVGYTGVDANGPDLFEDWGGHNSTPTVKVNFPKTLSTELSGTTTSSTEILGLYAVPGVGTLSFTNPQTLVCDVWVSVKAE